MSEFGRYLKEVREAANLSQEALADEAQISSAYISQIETGRRNPPTPDILRRMAPSLGVDYTLLLAAADYISERDLMALLLRALESLYFRGNQRAILEQAITQPIARWVAMSPAERTEALARTDADSFAELLIEELLRVQKQLILDELFPDRESWSPNG
jgi:transcriptional regulator with XRE-family HTH domain